jgi:cellulose synthase/poly-beta-1,6-N-acetylglucosamine synthase-like glycosyltransferase
MISVVIPVRNERDAIRRCLDAFARQTFRRPFEMLVVDNNCTDDTADVVRAFADEHPDLTVRVVPEPRLGVAAASQAGFDAASYGIIARTDADTIVDDHWLTAIADGFRDERVAALCGHVGFREPQPLQRWLQLERLIGLHQRTHIRLKMPHFWGFNFAVRGDVFRRAGGFDTRLKLAEDLDLGLRIQAVLDRDERIVYAPEMRVASSSRRYRLNRDWLRYTLDGYRAYFARAWFGRTPAWMRIDAH